MIMRGDSIRQIWVNQKYYSCHSSFALTHLVMLEETHYFRIYINLDILSINERLPVNQVQLTHDNI